MSFAGNVPVSLLTEVPSFALLLKLHDSKFQSRIRNLKITLLLRVDSDENSSGSNNDEKQLIAQHGLIYLGFIILGRHCFLANNMLHYLQLHDQHQHLC